MFSYKKWFHIILLAFNLISSGYLMPCAFEECAECCIDLYDNRISNGVPPYQPVNDIPFYQPGNDLPPYQLGFIPGYVNPPVQYNPVQYIWTNPQYTQPKIGYYIEFQCPAEGKRNCTGAPSLQTCSSDKDCRNIKGWVRRKCCFDTCFQSDRCMIAVPSFHRVLQTSQRINNLGLE